MEEKSRVKCPCCGNQIYIELGTYESCKHCGWTEDSYQEKHPDAGGCANHMCLNEAKKAYKEGKEVY